MIDFQPVETQEYNLHQLPVEVDAVIGDRLIKSSTAREISCEGLFLVTNSPVTVDESACVVLSFPDRDMPIKLKGKSVRVEADGVAVQFDSVSIALLSILLW